MKRTICTGLALILAGLMAAPASAQTIPPAAKGEVVVVTLRGESEIVGEVGKSFSDLGFYVKPANGAAYLIHRVDVVGIRVATTGAPRGLPAPAHRGMSPANKAAIAAVAIALGTLFLIRMNFFQPMG